MQSRYCPRRSRALMLATGATTVLALPALSPVQAQQSSISLQSQPVPTALQMLALNEGTSGAPNASVSEVVVSSNHSGDVEGALQEQLQSVGVNNVLSMEQIEQAPVSSVADLSALIPGLAQHRDQFLGQAATGEGQYISIRGFDTSLRTPSAFNFSGQHFLVRTQGQLAEQASKRGAILRRPHR